MEINCTHVVEKYLLNQNPLYAFSFPIAILTSIVIFGVVKAYNVSDNSYVNQILIPILAFLLAMVLVDIISRLMISKKELHRLTELCKLWMHEPSVKNHPILSKMIDMDLVTKYGLEKFSTESTWAPINVDEDGKIVKNKIINEQKNISVENVEIPFDTIRGLSPESIDYKKEDSKCIQESDSCSLCSGSNSNPAKLDAPIPGPQWLPQTAEAVQNRLKNNDYTASKC